MLGFAGPLRLGASKPRNASEARCKHDIFILMRSHINSRLASKVSVGFLALSDVDRQQRVSCQVPAVLFRLCGSQLIDSARNCTSLMGAEHGSVRVGSRKAMKPMQCPVSWVVANGKIPAKRSFPMPHKSSTKTHAF